jgi:hypothetical protein
LDNQAFFNNLGNVQEIITDVLMVCEGMDGTNCQIGEEQYKNISDGLYGLFAFALNHVYDKMSEMEQEFEDSHGVKWPVQMNEKEKADWVKERGRWL